MFHRWPIVMRKKTLAANLDCIQEDGKNAGHILRTFREWEKLPGFPTPDAVTCCDFWPHVDIVLERYYGEDDPIARTKRKPDAELGLWHYLWGNLVSNARTLT